MRDPWTAGAPPFQVSDASSEPSAKRTALEVGRALLAVVVQDELQTAARLTIDRLALVLMPLTTLTGLVPATSSQSLHGPLPLAVS